MSSQLPFFMSGPRLVIKMDGQILAFAVGMDITVSRNIQTVYQFGQISPVANQATLYNGVTGSMQIIKLADVDSRKGKVVAAQGNFSGPSTASGSIGLPTAADGGVVAGSGSSLNSSIQKTENLDNSSLNYSITLQNQLDPEKVLLSSTFDIEVWQTYPLDIKSTATSRNGTAYKTVKHFTIQNCRLNSRGTSIAPGSLTQESVGFVGTLLVSEKRDGGVRDAEDSTASEG